MLRPSRRSRLLGQERQHERRRGDDLGTRTRSGPAFTTDWPAAGRSASESASWRPPDGLPNPGRYPRAPPGIPQNARQSRFPPPLTPLTPPGPPPRLPPGPAIEGPAACGRRVAVPSRLPLPAAPLPVEFAARAPACAPLRRRSRHSDPFRAGIHRRLAGSGPLAAS